MCGITGYISKNHRKEDLIVMTDRLSHRGPDAAGYFCDEKSGIGLGHRRLSILDLSEAANQPFHSKCGRYVMVYNGEVYNFQTIAKKYAIPTITTSDTEVILEAYIKAGTKILNDLNGMFALAIWDKQDQSLFIARDRVGIKPLYYWQESGELVFGSELKSVTASTQLEKRLSVDNQAVKLFLHLGYIPEPYSIFKQVKKFPSGHYGFFKKGDFTFKKYWSPDEKITNDIVTDEVEAKAQLKELVSDAVKQRLVSDVPFGTFLSGGTDSSLVTAMAQKHSMEKVNTFTIGFENSGFNEAPYAKTVSDHLGTRHHEFIITEKEAKDLLPTITSRYDEPFGDPSAIPTMLVSKIARKHVTMTLAGDGGDELFHGYNSYFWANRLSNPFLKTFRKPISFALGQLKDKKYQKAARLLAYSDLHTLPQHIFSEEGFLFNEREIDRLLNTKKNAINFVTNGIALSRDLMPIEKQALFDFKFYLKDQLLVKVDRASMAYSLETRVPLLDHRLVEFALNLSPELKFNNKTTKYLLKEVLYDYVPAKYYDRPKWGFGIPVAQWLRSDLKPLLMDVLSEKNVTEAGFVKWGETQKILQLFLTGNDFYYKRIWLLFLLHNWWQENKYASN